jgi:hypothetical protein
VNLQDGTVFQDAREVRTKFAKTFTTTFFPVGDEIRTIVECWLLHLREVNLWGNDDPLFPATLVNYQRESGEFKACGLNRMGWSNASPVRKIFREAFEAAGLPYFNPHSFRHTLVQLGETLCPSPEAFKAWSQNLGHENVLTTFYSYGEVAPNRQREIIQNLGQSSGVAKDAFDMDALATAIAAKLAPKDLSSPQQ